MWLMNKVRDLFLTQYILNPIHLKNIRGDVFTYFKLFNQLYADQVTNMFPPYVGPINYIS